MRVVVTLVLMPCSFALESLGAESNTPPPVSRQAEGTSVPQTLSQYSQLQEELRQAQLAVERNRQATKEAAGQYAAALSKGLETIELAFARQRAQDRETLQRSNRAVIVVAGTFAAVGVITMVMIACFQWRMSKRLTELSAALPIALGLDSGPAVPALEAAPEPPRGGLAAGKQWEDRPRQLPHGPPLALKPPKGGYKPIERWLFPNGGDSLRRRQLRALKLAVMVGLVCAALMVAVLYLVYARLGH